MCIDKKNDKKPKGFIFYKVYYELDGQLYYLMRTETGHHHYGEDKKVPKRKLTATEIGFHCWETKSSAEEFARLIRRIHKNGTLIQHKKFKVVVVEVNAEKHIQSGTQYTNQIEDIFPAKKPKKGQVFTFKYIKVLR